MTIFQHKATVIIILVLIGCNDQSKSDRDLTKPKLSKTDENDSVFESEKLHNPHYYLSSDTLTISTENLGTYKYSKEDFNRIVDNHPELYNDYWESPDEKFYCYGDNAEFGSEAGKDHYYFLYSYFLKQKNGIKKYAKQRKKLIDIYRKINSIFQRIEHGGTYFGYQYQRVLGYAEYSVYLLSVKNDNLKKTYDFSNQKELYIKSLRQLIEDELKIDDEILEKEKEKRKQDLNKTVDELNTLIKDLFYLRRAQEFQYSHYNYY
jgi:hypothetical protein